MAEQPHQPKVMTDAERDKLTKTLDEELDQFIEGLQKSQYKDGWKEETWEKEMQEHPFFRSKPFEDGEELPPLIQGLQALKYDPSLHTEEELASTYKEDGNLCFKVKKYKHAVLNYTEGLRKRHPNIELITQLLTNRAAANFHLGNFRSSLRDCERAVRLTPGHMKAILRAVQCCTKLGRSAEALSWCDRGLAVDSTHAELVRLHHAATAQQRVEERNRRQAALKERKQKAADDRLLAALAERGVSVLSEEGKPVSGAAVRPELLVPQVPGLETGVQLTDSGDLSWPLMFLYPEHSQSDLVRAALDTDPISGHLEAMFGADGGGSPEWDTDGAYRPDRLEVYYEYEDGLETRVVRVRTDSRIRDVLADKRYVVKGGVPGFIVLPRDSPFRTVFLGRYQVDER
ncbi:tetratricopeptide repeat protein 4-like [Amphibalanus amphitrite]|uniref:tetratricopeptide repeat protein 4-like n=1 Tax=Amphibalanus amphitrite TaxID=1232801 RepID=UPI001C90DEC1|nr:tetratricopeptide repeat protein 4-like [Amphibalanus amphitrite]XP_043199018.1 tetratricopeptide repeat protein 4-like [Amphibalanus amphitrite]XP_043199025.1 tetratricopeptide repeat protein 4-like [Amphibalanus amphitrite]XP_043199035.1 tetratricopeptide repeat protein 4-like [Amphibalanus amphitrite]XP_043199043.1 tetratricopeptide repeat protein 4-like [Amphibalanus amphitrite]XP_043199050.1 tetratricopeptide repeat protein 4-like [Amphibalanus amphitrite]XP_043199056.1 tetratricopept